MFSSIQIRYTGRPYLLRQSDSFWHVPKIVFSKGNLGPDLMGLGQNEVEMMIKGRSHGRLFLKFVFKWISGDCVHVVRVAVNLRCVCFLLVRY